MPLIFLLVVAVAAPLLIIALIPLGLVQRYRAGASRRVARRWVATFNLGGLCLSILLFVGGAALANVWVKNALTYSLIGLTAGCLLGVMGLALTRWESVAGQVHYTPCRWLVLSITLLVAARIVYGFWRLWQGWSMRTNDGAWLVQSGVAGSFGAGALVLGYAAAYWAGIRRKAPR